MIGVPSAPKATGAVLAMSDRPDAASGVKPRPISIAPVTATGVPKPAAPSKNAPKAECDEQQLQPLIARDGGDAAAQNREQAALVRQLIEKDDVEHDPADREEAVGHAETGRGERHRRRHPEDDRWQSAATSPSPSKRRDVRLHAQEAQRPEQHDNRQGRQRSSRAPRFLAGHRLVTTSSSLSFADVTAAPGMTGSSVSCCDTGPPGLRALVGHGRNRLTRSLPMT